MKKENNENYEVLFSIGQGIWLLILINIDHGGHFFVNIYFLSKTIFDALRHTITCDKLCHIFNNKKKDLST